MLRVDRGWSVSEDVGGSEPNAIEYGLRGHSPCRSREDALTYDVTVPYSFVHFVELICLDMVSCLRTMTHVLGRVIFSLFDIHVWYMIPFVMTVA